MEFWFWNLPATPTRCSWGMSGLGTNHAVCSDFCSENPGFSCPSTCCSHRGLRPILPQGLCTSSFLHSEPLPLVLAKPGCFLSFKFQLKCQLLRNALLDTCPDSGDTLLIMISRTPSLFPAPAFHQLFSVCSLCLPLGSLSFSNQVCPYIIVSLALSRMACNRCSLHILGLTEWIGNLWRKKEKYCSWKEQKCTESNFLI